jgi:5-methylcytosine-specific restriction endonuclease McrA
MSRNKLRDLVYMKYDGHCGYCGRGIKRTEFQVDHIIPKRNYGMNGKTVPAAKHSDEVWFVLEKEKAERCNSFDNLMPTCRSCNHYKRANDLEGYRLLMKGVLARLRKVYIFNVAENYGIIKSEPWDGKFYFERDK